MFDEFIYTRPFLYTGRVKTYPRKSNRIGELFGKKREDELTERVINIRDANFIITLSTSSITFCQLLSCTTNINSINLGIHISYQYLGRNEKYWLWSPNFSFQLHMNDYSNSSDVIFEFNEW